MMMGLVWDKVTLRYCEVLKQKCPIASWREILTYKRESWVEKQIWKSSSYG